MARIMYLMAMDKSIRVAAASDCDILMQLMTVFYAEADVPLDPKKAINAFALLLNDPQLGQAWIMQYRGMTAGYAVLTLGFSMEYAGRDAFVDDLFVLCAYRGCGLGRLAMETILHACGERDVKALHLEVGRNNPSAKKLYHRFGFAQTDRQLMTLKLG